MEDTFARTPDEQDPASEAAEGTPAADPGAGAATGPDRSSDPEQVPADAAGDVPSQLLADLIALGLTEAAAADPATQEAFSELDDLIELVEVQALEAYTLEELLADADDDEDVEFDEFDEFDMDDWDDMQTDPGCAHPWYRLDFVEDDLGFGCSRCGRSWLLDDEDDARDAALVVWQASRQEFERLADQHDQLAAVVEEMSGKRRCVVCDRWAEQAEFVRLAETDETFSRNRHCCREHVGALLERSDYDPDLVAAAATWLEGAGASTSTSIDVQWLVERNISDFPPLGAIMGRTDEMLPAVTIDVTAAVAARLGTPAQVTIGDVATALTNHLGFDYPTTRPAWTFLLGVLAQIDRAHRIADGQPTEMDSADIARGAFPSQGTWRAVIIMDLCRSELPEEGSFSGDMADDLVLSIAARAVDLFTGSE